MAGATSAMYCDKQNSPSTRAMVVTALLYYNTKGSFPRGRKLLTWPVQQLGTSTSGSRISNLCLGAEQQQSWPVLLTARVSASKVVVTVVSRQRLIAKEGNTNERSG